MKKILILILLTLIIISDLIAQKKISRYQTENGDLVLVEGDTIEFLEGSLGGQFVHVFFMVGKIQKRKATFSTNYYTELIINHFLQRKEKGKTITYAVMNIPNKPKWFVWARLDEALDNGEIKLKSR